MLEGVYRNKKTAFFCLILMDFVIATQLVVFSVFLDDLDNFERNWVMKSYFISFVLALFIFGFFLDAFRDFGKNKKLINQGLIFFMLGNLVCLFSPQMDLLIMGRIVTGLATGMIALGQMGIIWHMDYKEEKKFSFAVVMVFFLGFFVGPYIVNSLLWFGLGRVKISLILGVLAATLAILGINQSADEKAELTPSYLQSRKKRLAVMGIGYLGNAVIVYGFDYFLYPYVIWKYGTIEGGVVMTFLSFLICYLSIVFYDWAKQDWLGIETIKEVKEYDGRSMIGRFSSWILKKSDPLVLLFLSIKFDPFITTAYMRKGAEKYNGLGKRDWGIFMASLLVGNIYWTFVAFTGVSIIEYAIGLAK